jgi:hypothetical protein
MAGLKYSSLGFIDSVIDGRVAILEKTSKKLVQDAFNANNNREKRSKVKKLISIIDELKSCEHLLSKNIAIYKKILSRVIKCFAILNEDYLYTVNTKETR